jgi:hypothetical protein
MLCRDDKNIVAEAPEKHSGTANISKHLQLITQQGRAATDFLNCVARGAYQGEIKWPIS